MFITQVSNVGRRKLLHGGGNERSDWYYIVPWNARSLKSNKSNGDTQILFAKSTNSREIIRGENQVGWTGLHIDRRLTGYLVTGEWQEREKGRGGGEKKTDFPTPFITHLVP